MKLSSLLLLLALPISAQQVTLSCSGPCGGSSAGPNCGYGFFRSADGGRTYDPLNYNPNTFQITPSSTCGYVDTNVLYNGATYDYYAITIDPSYPVPESGASNYTSATMAAQAPSDQAATLDYPAMPTGAVIPPGVTATWATNPGQNVSGYDFIIQELQSSGWVATYWYWNSHGAQLIPASQRSLALPIPQNGFMVHIYFRTWFVDGTYSWQDLFYRETAPAGIPQVLSPIQYTTQCSANGLVTFTWSNGPSDTVNYYFHAGTGPGGWDLVNSNVGLVNTAQVNLLGQGPRIVWVSISANSPSKGEVAGDVYASAYVACHAIN